RWPRDWSSDVCSSDLAVLRKRLIDTIGVPPAPSTHLSHRTNMIRTKTPATMARGTIEIFPNGGSSRRARSQPYVGDSMMPNTMRSEEHTSELQSRGHL